MRQNNQGTGSGNIMPICPPPLQLANDLVNAVGALKETKIFTCSVFLLCISEEYSAPH
jgi:hypothetical protein